MRSNHGSWTPIGKESMHGFKKTGIYFLFFYINKFSLTFSPLQELNVTLDGVEMIQGLPLQEDPFQFNVDDKPLYVGGSHHGRHGFVGCIRSLYVNGRIHDLKGIAQGMEDYGVYPGKLFFLYLIPLKFRLPLIFASRGGRKLKGANMGILKCLSV